MSPSDDFEKIYQAQCISKIKGAYFQFSRNLTKNPVVELYGETVCLESERKKIALFEADNDAPYLVVVHPTHGRPGSLAYKIWTGIEKRLSNFEQATFETTIAGITKLANLSKKGNQSEAIEAALDQLENTIIRYHSRAFLDARNSPNETKKFSLLKYKKHKINKRVYYVITVDPLIVDQLFEKNKFYICNWDRIKGLSPANQCYAFSLIDAMTRRYIKYLKAEENGKFVYNKSHKAICIDWMGATQPRTTEAQAARQTNSRNKAVVDCGLLSDIPEIVATTLNTVFQPGNGFFDDYKALYERADKYESDDKEIKEIVALFGRTYFGTDKHKHSIYDFATADALIQKHGYDEAKEFVLYTCRLAILERWNNIRQLSALNKKEYVAGFNKYINAKQRDNSSNVDYTEEQHREFRSYLDQWYINHYSDLYDDQKAAVDKFIEEYFVSNPETLEYDRQNAIRRMFNPNEPTIQQWASGVRG